MFVEVRSAVASLEGVARVLDPCCFDGSSAAALLEDVAQGERICAAMKAVLARRVQECGFWKQDGSRSAKHWLAAKTGVHVSTAERILETARDLDALPETAAAFRAGELSEVQAHHITDAGRVDPNAETQLLAAAAAQSTVKGLKDVCRQVNATARADDVAWARQLHVSRYLRSWEDRDGALRLDAKLAPDAGARLLSALKGHEDRVFKAAHKAGRHEKREAYAADALVAAVTEGPAKKVEVRVLADQSALRRGYVEPGERCEIRGIGPIPVATARALMDDATIHLVDPDGIELADYTSTAAYVPAALRRWVETKYPVCGRSSCANDQFLEIDHVIPREHGGPTHRDNLWCLCPTCHKLKHLFHWKITGTPHHWDLVPPDHPEPPWAPEPVSEPVLELATAVPP